MQDITLPWYVGVLMIVYIGITLPIVLADKSKWNWRKKQQ